jgi:hypothetical protein
VIGCITGGVEYFSSCGEGSEALCMLCYTMCMSAYVLCIDRCRCVLNYRVDEEVT